LTPRIIHEKPEILKNLIPFSEETVKRAKTCFREAKNIFKKFPFVVFVGNPKTMLITPWHLAPVLTKKYGIELLPENLYFPNGFIVKPGKHKIKIIHQNSIYTTLEIDVKCRQKI
ncbi:hypothetical protein MXB_2858, partial [Myxobolus squamalis]